VLFRSRIETERVPPLIYPFGSRGPPAADDLVRRCGYEYDHRYSVTFNRKDAGKALDKFLAMFDIRTPRLLKLLNDFILEMERGLSGEESSMKMIPSFVSNLATGRETGSYFAIDLGGSNLRVLSLELDGAGNVTDVVEQKAVIPEEIMKGHGSTLFGFIADAVKRAGPPPGASVGFTFSFPVNQTALNSGTLMQWTKGFECAGVVGHDVAALLQEALRERGVEVVVSALVNDTVGTLMAKSYVEPRCRVGVILGTGTNGAYVERCSAIPKWTGHRDGFMVVNMEWGGFGSGQAGRSILPLTSVDNKLDALSPNPSKQRFEKTMSGMYLGELLRLSLLDLTTASVLTWGGTLKPPASCLLYHPWQFQTKFNAEIAADESDDLSGVKEVFVRECGAETSHEDRVIIKAVCQAIARRAAKFVAVGIAGCVTKMGADALDCVAGIDGSVFNLYPKFQEYIKEGLAELGVHCAIESSADGSGLGAAVIAATAGAGIGVALSSPAPLSRVPSFSAGGGGLGTPSRL